MNDIPRRLAQAAHEGTSLVPEERADSEQRGYAKTLLADYEMLLRYATTPEKKSVLAAEFPRYREGFKKRKLAQLGARSRIVSVMVAGPSNFPTARMRKRNDTEQRRTNELLEYRERALEVIKKELTPELRPIMTGDADAASRLKEKIQKAEQHQEFMKAANAAIRKHAKKGADAQVAALVALNLSEGAARKLLEPDFAGRIGFPDFELKNNGAEIRRLKERLAHVERVQSMPDSSREGIHARIEDAPAENRVRLFFPGKPDERGRAHLKAMGFRWAPTLGCWQAFRNPRSLEAAAAIAGPSVQAPQEVAHGSP